MLFVERVWFEWSSSFLKLLSMCGCERQPSFSASLEPPQGDTLVFNDGVTWIGRGSFTASTRAQLLCSRRQACFKLTETGLSLECHGINPLLFVVCRSRDFNGTEATPAAELFQLQKGEAVELTDGDQFYFAAMECLLTVVIRQNDIGPTLSRDALELPLQQASEACVKEKEENLLEYCLPDEEQLAVIPRDLQCRAQDCGTSEPQSCLMKNNSAMCAISSTTVAASHCPGVAEPHEGFVASEPSGNPVVDCRLLERPRDGSVRNDQDDSDSLGLDAYDCASVGVSQFNVQPLRCISPREEVPDRALIPGNNRGEMSESCQICAEDSGEGVLTIGTVAEVLEDVKCSQLIIDREECGPSNDRREEYEPIGSEDCNLLLSSETIDGRSFEEVFSPEPVRPLDSDLDFGEADNDTLSRSPVSGIRDECLIRMAVKEHLPASGTVYEREDDPVITADVEDESWRDGPVEGMEPVIVSVSGYEGVDRQNLVKLINKTGAAFTGVFSKANTHLVCWSFHGKKFDKAVKLHKVVVNHQWLEDCLRVGKKLSEDPYKLRSGEDVGPLKWKESPPPLVIGRAELSNGATNQHLSDHGTSFWNSFDQEDNTNQQGQHAVCETSYRKDLSGPSRQAGVANVEAGHTGGRKSRRLIKRSGVEVRIDPIIAEQENLVRGNPAASSSSGRVGESYQSRTGEFAGCLEQGYNTRRRKSASSALHNAGQEQGHDIKRRKSASSVLGRGIDGGALSNLRDNMTGRNRLHSSSAPDRVLDVINLADDADDDVREIGLRISKAASAQVTGGINADTNRNRTLQDIQFSQHDSQIACAICLVEAKSSSEGLLECGHRFCYKCIFTWTTQAVKGPSCPLCKASCEFITRQEVSSSGKLDETVVVVGKKEMGLSTRSERTVVLDHVCIQCGNSDSESLLMRCGTCGNRAIHNFCMDPPVPPPWFCPGCMHGHRSESMRLAWNQALPGPSTSAYAGPTQPVTRPSNVRRRSTQPYAFRRPSRPVSTYRPSLHTELTQSMGPVRRRNVVGQHSLRSWLTSDTSNGDS